MALPFHTSVRNAGIIDDDWTIAFNLDSAIVIGDVGKMVTLDLTGPNKAKLAVADSVLLGRLETFEDRPTGKVGTVAMKGIMKVTSTSASVALGDTVDGTATAGIVKTSTTPNRALNYVVEIDNTNHVHTVVFP